MATGPRIGRQESCSAKPWARALIVFATACNLRLEGSCRSSEPMERRVKRLNVIGLSLKLAPHKRASAKAQALSHRQAEELVLLLSLLGGVSRRRTCPPRIALGLAADLFLGHSLTTRAHRGETTTLNPAPQTSGFDGRDHGSPSDVQMTRASAAAPRGWASPSSLSASTRSPLVLRRGRKYRLTHFTHSGATGISVSLDRGTAHFHAALETRGQPEVQSSVR